MMIPTVHLNGTGAPALLQELHTAYLALQEAIVALRQVTVHGRDYYPQGQHAYGQARDEMDRRLGQLADVQRDVQTMYESLEQQIGAR